jgi:uncharacterized phage protein (TIGR02216 family)
MAEATPWREMLSRAVFLGLCPGDFWRLSVAEWRVLVGLPQTGALGRAELRELMQLYPDRNHD